LNEELEGTEYISVEVGDSRSDVAVNKGRV